MIASRQLEEDDNLVLDIVQAYVLDNKAKFKFVVLNTNYHTYKKNQASSLGRLELKQLVDNQGVDLGDTLLNDVDIILPLLVGSENMSTDEPIQVDPNETDSKEIKIQDIKDLPLKGMSGGAEQTTSETTSLESQQATTTDQKTSASVSTHLQTTSQTETPSTTTTTSSQVKTTQQKTTLSAKAKQINELKAQEKAVLADLVVKDQAIQSQLLAIDQKEDDLSHQKQDSQEKAKVVDDLNDKADNKDSILANELSKADSAYSEAIRATSKPSEDQIAEVEKQVEKEKAAMDQA